MGEEQHTLIRSRNVATIYVTDCRLFQVNQQHGDAFGFIMDQTITCDARQFTSERQAAGTFTTSKFTMEPESQPQHSQRNHIMSLYYSTSNLRLRVQLSALHPSASSSTGQHNMCVETFTVRQPTMEFHMEVVLVFATL